jgi:hypothetical protein
MIRKMRLARRSWPEIARELGRLGVTIDRSAVRKFFKRAQGGKLPLGFEPGHLVETPAPGSASVKSGNLLKRIAGHLGSLGQKGEEAEDIYDQARAAVRNDQKGKLTIVKSNGLL